MWSGRAAVLLAVAASSSPAPANENPAQVKRAAMNRKVVPAELAAAVEGAWDLGTSYHIALSRSGKGLHVHQEAQLRLRGRARRDDEVEYDPAARTLHFPGLGAIHRTVVALRWSAPELEYAFSSELSHGKWRQGVWEKARRARPQP